MAVQERLAYHELLRVGLARQEDLQLLQQSAVHQDPPLPRAAAKQLIHECRLREEWRTSREQQLLQQLSRTHLASLTDTETQKLADQILSLQQVQSHAQSRSKARPSSASAVGSQVAAGALSSLTLPPSSYRGSSAPTTNSRGSLGAALKLYGSTPRAPRHPSPAPKPNTPPPVLSMPPMSPASAMLQRSSSKKPLAPTTAHSRTTGPFSSSAIPHSHAPQVLTLLTPQQLRRQVSASRENRQGQASATTPDSAPTTPLTRPGKSAGTSPVRSAPVPNQPSSLSVQARPRLPESFPFRAQALGQGVGRPTTTGDARLRPPRTAPTPSAAQGAAGAFPREQGRFQTLLRLQGTMMQGLLQHAAAGGAEAAYDAMCSSVRQMQAHFGTCVHEAQVLMGVAASGGDGEAGGGSGGGSGAAALRARNWARLLQLGQLGLTTHDITALQRLRAQIAARTIQRAVRQWLRRVRHVRAVEAARVQAQQAALRLRTAAATIIQRYYRGALGRRRAAALRVEAERRQRQARLALVVEKLAALRIQRAWRAHRKRARAAHALAASSMQMQPITRPDAAGSGAAAAAALSSPRAPPAKAAAPTSPLPKATRGFGVGGLPVNPARASQARFVPQTTIETPGSAARAAQDAAATSIQAVFRGWRVRRSEALWWQGCKHAMRGRRVAAREWEQHQMFMRATYGLQEQLVGLVLSEAEAGARALNSVRAEREGFEAAWAAWLREQAHAALSQPLPKGWVPHPHPETNRMCFLDTRTGALHAHHPAIMQLQSFASTQRAAAEEQVVRRETEVAAFLHDLHHHNSWQQGALLGEMMRVRAAVGVGAKKSKPGGPPTS